MEYITIKQSPIHRQMTLEEFLFQTQPVDTVVNANLTNTKTYEFEHVSVRFKKAFDFPELIEKLRKYNATTEHLRTQARSDLYNTFHIPKKSGGLRRIDAPKPELMDALRRLKTIFEEDFKVLYHTSAFAYVRGRSTIDAVKRHQKNESKWFGKYDLSDFFGSTTVDFVMQQFSMVFPISEVIKYESGKRELRKALELAFLNGGLPQGTPISPLITNVMMIPIDFKLSNTLRDYEKNSYIYTRYADDFIISSKFDFDSKKVEELLVGTLSGFEAPFTINAAKTRYGSSAGRNWNLGVMLNKDNNITIGHKKKRQFQSMLHNYIMDRKNEISWDRHDLQTLSGYHSYYRMVEPDVIDNIISHINKKMGVNVLRLIKQDLQ